jgi:hypothetical protein
MCRLKSYSILVIVLSRVIPFVIKYPGRDTQPTTILFIKIGEALINEGFIERYEYGLENGIIEKKCNFIRLYI